MPETSTSTNAPSAKLQGDVVRGEKFRQQSTQSAKGQEPILDSLEKETTQQVTRLAARLNASKTTDKEREDLLKERTALIQKVLAETITRKEQVRLEYVRWSLDRIEDARHGPAMDRLETQIDEFRKLAGQMMGLRDNLEELASTKRRR